MSTEVPAGVRALPWALWSGAGFPQQPAWAWVRGGRGAGSRWWVVLTRPQVHAAPHPGRAWWPVSPDVCWGVTV